MQTETLVSLISIIATIIGSTASIAYWLGKKFSEIDKKFSEIDKKFNEIDKRFDEIDRKFNEINKKFSEIDEKFTKIDKEFNKVHEEIKTIDRKVESITKATQDQLEFFSEFLGFRGIFTDKDIAFVKSELQRLSARATNPLTKEELKRIRELIKKDELTFEEADELRELARKFVSKYWHIPGAYKLLIYASIMRGIAMRKLETTK
ncbi:MAG: hypothetical protein DRJ52_07695, partial [Thermoprotei archaeon]